MSPVREGLICTLSVEEYSIRPANRYMPDCLCFFFVKEDPSVDLGNSKRVKFKDIVSMLKINPYCWMTAGISGLYNLMTDMAVGSYYFT